MQDLWYKADPGPNRFATLALPLTGLFLLCIINKPTVLGDFDEST